MLRNLLIFIILALFTAGCSLFKSLQGDYESANPVMQPPADYDPVFFKSIADINTHTLQEPRIAVSRVEPHGADKVKVYAHLFDEGGYYLSGADEGVWKDKWCDKIIVNYAGNMTPQNLTITEVESRKPLAVALVMDHSGSMGSARAMAVQDAAEMFIRNKQPDDKITLVKYDSKVIVESIVSNNSVFLLNKLNKNGLEGFGGMTATSDAISQALDLLSPLDDTHEKVVIVFTDGYDNSSKIAKDSVIDKAIRSDIPVCAIDFGYNIDEIFMKEYAEETNGIYHHIYLKEEFGDVFSDIYNRFRYYYLIEFDQPAYGEHTLSIKNCFGNDEQAAIVEFSNVPKPGRINLLKVYFDYNKADIKSESKPAIEKVTALMQMNPAMKIEIRGHTDSSNRSGDPDYNKKLSQKRADAVKKAIVDSGISGNRIKCVGFGESQPVADNNTEEGRAKNRRTEFVILGK
jgi:outer membrane protein OmpA-like peptidoglycan-associated protein/Mg-chelatase subunit ChlD